ncbi:hypothetical protein JOE66_000276 [Subtercola frigoramans]|uniref:Transposase DDE domain-containing protein n=1 Tax=Subtercola frigoramans TaxID=120298 RepID=A0ABS2L0N8_9MICO|nr:hypothetical protein [Subtercola frigoramans]
MRITARRRRNGPRRPRDHPTTQWHHGRRRGALHRVQLEGEEGPCPRASDRATHPGADLERPTLFDTHRFHALFTTPALDTVTADQVHRRHAIIEQVHDDLKCSALAHLPSGRFTANAAWLVLAVIAFNLTRTAATITRPDLPTIRRKLITVPARIASSGRRITLHLPRAWPWEAAWTTLFSHALAPPQS